MTLYEAKKMEQARKKKNISRRVLAEKVGVNPVTIWRWEKGEAVPHPTMRKAWEAALGVGR